MKLANFLKCGVLAIFAIVSCTPSGEGSEATLAAQKECYDLKTKDECESKADADMLGLCFWLEDAEGALCGPWNCEAIEDESLCARFECNWESEACVKPSGCVDQQDEESCKAFGSCAWTDENCKSLYLICAEITDAEQCSGSEHGCSWVDEYCDWISEDVS
jgi:hypothetical protein